MIIHKSPEYTRISEHYNKAALSHVENTSSLDKNKRPTPRFYLPPQEATTRKGGSLLPRQRAVDRRPRTTVYDRFHVIYIILTPITISEVHILIRPVATFVCYFYIEDIAVKEFEITCDSECGRFRKTMADKPTDQVKAAIITWYKQIDQ